MNMWYKHIKKDFYFIIGLSRLEGGANFLHFPYILTNVVRDN
jgi:hypothetical protein